MQTKSHQYGDLHRRSVATKKKNKKKDEEEKGKEK